MPSHAQGDTLFPEGYDQEPRAHARRTDPETSHAAARSIKADDIRQTQKEVYNVFRLHRRLTDAELVAIFGGLGLQQSPSGIRTRRNELVAKGLLVDTGETKRVEGSRTSHKIWGLAK